MDDLMELTVDRGAVLRAEALIRPHVRTTPVVQVAAADLGLDAALPPLTLKLEYLQRGGSFKSRGAFTNLLARPVPAAGVVAASGGNHGVGVALAAEALGVPAAIFVPSIASPAKIAQIRGHGARLVVGGERYADALAASEAYQAESGALAVHAYDQPETLAGQGTVALELDRQAPELDTLLVAVGGGGLLGGIAAYGEGRPKLIAVEPEAAPTLHRALAAGRPVDAPAGGIAADSLAPRQVGRLMFPLAERFVAASVLVEDRAIRQAQRLLWQRLRAVVEPGGAAALAALLSARYRPAAGERIGVLLCGANTDVVQFPEP
ncbi:MAG TPA: threonine/serine dehydratase [Kiloniellales bacterium]|nr:threonine/serine dehydratase [Kiloniellales bacterium]